MNEGMSMTLVLAVVAAALAAPVALYPMYTGLKARMWEHGVSRDAQGVMQGAQSYEVGEGEVGLLMIHGFASSPAVFQRMAPALAERGFRCRVIRLPGFGQPVGQASFHSAVWRRVIEVETAALRESCRDVWLVGHSMGATLALDHVLRGGRVDGLVLMTPLIEVAQARSVLMPPRAWFELGRKVWPQRALIETAFPVDIQEPLPGMDELRDLYLPMAAYGEMFAVVDQIQGQAPAISCPVLMAVAPSDLVVDSEAARVYFDDLGSSRKQLLSLPGSGHVLPLDREWAVMVEAVEQFTRK